jgi:REP element-mobilizing transposase RayT
VQKGFEILFGNVGAINDRSKNVPLTDLGATVRQSIENIPKSYPAVSVDNYVIMPNHIHLLLQIHSESSGRSMIAPTISTVVRLMKGDVSKQAGHSIWQKGFYDHVIHGEQDYLEVWNYIEGNPNKWADDELCVSELK